MQQLLFMRVFLLSQSYIFSCVANKKYLRTQLLSFEEGLLSGRHAGTSPPTGRRLNAGV